MAKGALHATAVLLHTLMADQAYGWAPLREPCLVRSTVTNRARCNMGHVGPVVRLGIPGMAHHTVRGRLVMKGMAACTHLRAGPATGLHMTGRAGQTHLGVRLMGE